MFTIGTILNHKIWVERLKGEPVQLTVDSTTAVSAHLLTGWASPVVAMTTSAKAAKRSPVLRHNMTDLLWILDWLFLTGVLQVQGLLFDAGRRGGGRAAGAMTLPAANQVKAGRRG